MLNMSKLLDAFNINGIECRKLSLLIYEIQSLSFQTVPSSKLFNFRIYFH